MLQRVCKHAERPRRRHAMPLRAVHAIRARDARAQPDLVVRALSQRPMWGRCKPVRCALSSADRWFLTVFSLRDDHDFVSGRSRPDPLRAGRARDALRPLFRPAVVRLTTTATALLMPHLRHGMTTRTTADPQYLTGPSVPVAEVRGWPRGSRGARVGFDPRVPQRVAPRPRSLDRRARQAGCRSRAQQPSGRGRRRSEPSLSTVLVVLRIPRQTRRLARSRRAPSHVC